MKKGKNLIEEFPLRVRKNKLLSLKFQHLPLAPEGLLLICQVEPISEVSFGTLSLSRTRFKNFFVPLLRQMISTTFFIRGMSLKLIMVFSFASRKIIFNAINIAFQLLPWSDCVMLLVFVSFLLRFNLNKIANGDHDDHGIPISLTNSDKIRMFCFLVSEI